MSEDILLKILGELKEIRIEQGKQGERLDRVEVRLDQMGERLDRVEGRLDRMETKIDTMQTDIQTMQTDIQILKGGQQGIRSEITDRFSVIKFELRGLRSDIEFTYHKAALNELEIVRLKNQG